MAASPKYKVFNPSGEYIASCKHASDAAALVVLYGNGAEIRTEHARSATVWREGTEPQSASESYDFVADTIAQREDERFSKFYERQPDGTVQRRKLST